MKILEPMVPRINFLSKFFLKLSIYLSLMLGLFKFSASMNLNNIETAKIMLKACCPKTLRNNLYLQANENYKYLTYKKSKEILHNEINLIDIYGDKTEELNVEHVFPQSFFKNNTNNKFMKSDLHNLYLCNSKLNRYRQNFKYIDPIEIDTYFINEKSDKVLDIKGNVIQNNNELISELFHKSGYLMISNKKTKTFIPTGYSKGKIARSISYFAIKYNYTDVIDQVIDPLTLIKWNLKDPVSDEEYLKNIISYKYQKNVNPFIMNSDLMLFAFSDLLDKKFVEDEKFLGEILLKKRYSYIDPFKSIEYFISKNE